MIEPRVATGKDGPEAQRNAVYMSASPDEAALYALVRPAVGRRGGWAIRGGNVHYVEDPRIPLNTEGYVYHADIPDGQYRQPPQTNPQIGYTVDSAVAPQGKTRVTLDDHRRRFISYPDKDALRSALAGMTTDQEKMAEVATKKDPTLWQEAKRDAVRRMDGVHSARAMQLASKLYKERGGTYAGKKPAPSQNSLRTWTKQKWKWSDGDRPGQGGEGVYLPSKSVSALKSTASGREKLRQAREVKEDATSRGQQFSQHGLHVGKQRDKTAALRLYHDTPHRLAQIELRQTAGNVFQHKRSDTDKIASIYADRSTQTMFNESASGLEGRMVLRQLDEVCNMAQELMQVIPEDADVPEWVQNHVATINDRLKSVHSYVVYEMKRSGPSMDSAGMIQQAQQLAPDMSEMSSDPHEMDELQAKTSAYRAAMWQAFNRTLHGR